jgi:xanthine dehydrogenase large subunit
MADSGAAARILPVLNAPIGHDSAARHVSGEALYIDDIPEPPGLLHLHVGQSTKARARITRLDLSAVRAAPGVVAVLTPADVPGKNDISPFAGDDPLFAEGEVSFHGQALFCVAAETLPKARAAAALAVVEYEDLPPLLTTEAALAAASFIEPSQTMTLGDAPSAIAAAPYSLSGHLKVGGQEHFYLEGQVALVVPGEGASHPGPRAGLRRRRHHGRGPAHGRRLRRQGNPVGAVGGHGGAGCAAHPPPGEDPPRPRRRHDHDRQAA